MSKTIPAALQTHIDGSATTLATCVKLVRSDATEMYFTDHDEDIVYDGDTYEADDSFIRTNTSTSSDFKVDNLDIVGILSSDKIKHEDIRAGVYDQSEIYIFLINYNSPSDGIIKHIRGILGNITIKDGLYTAEFRSLHQRFSKNALKVYTPLCHVDLGSTECGVNLASYTFAGKVGAVETDKEAMTIISTDSPEATEFTTDGYFTGGRIEFTSGNNNGYSMEIKRHTGSPMTIELFLPMGYSFAVDDTFNIIRGCDKKLTTCRDTFSNIDNFRGFPSVPGLNIHDYPDAK